MRGRVTHFQLTDRCRRGDSLGIRYPDVARLHMSPDEVDSGEKREGHGGDYEKHRRCEEEEDAGDAECSGRHVGVGGKRRGRLLEMHLGVILYA